MSVPYNITRDPALVKNRIFVGNLPVCTREELESICNPYGKVLGSLVQKNFGFVQFETEELANKCAAALHKSTFKSNMLTVRNASIKVQKTKAQKKLQNAAASQGAALSPGVAAAGPGNAGQIVPNDCEIIVVNRENTKYAEFVEDRLRQASLRVDVLFPNEDVMLGKVLANISARGCLYAVLVTPQHEKLHSITVNILYGAPAEHRNMPLEDAITLIETDFHMKKQHDLVAASPKMPLKRPMHPQQLLLNDQGRHPEELQVLLHLLVENRPLSAFEYDRVIKYLQERYEKQRKKELGEASAQAKLLAPDPEIELQKKILSIMNKPSVTEINCELMYPTFESAKQDKRLMELLQDSRVMAALESNYNSDLLDTVSEYL